MNPTPDLTRRLGIRYPVFGPKHHLPYPHQNALTRPMRTAAGKAGRSDYMSLCSGQGLRLARREQPGDLIAQWITQAERTVAQVAGAARQDG